MVHSSSMANRCRTWFAGSASKFGNGEQAIRHLLLPIRHDVMDNLKQELHWYAISSSVRHYHVT
jgi:hypothetical protein